VSGYHRTVGLVEGAFRHAALAPFTPLQSIVSEGGPELVLARTKSGTLVIVKVLLDRAIPPEVASQLSRETSQAARLTHDAIVQTRAMVLEDEVAALVTEFVPGVSLQRLLRFAAARSVRLPDDAGWYVVERVVSALAFAHSQKDHAGTAAPILHRAVSPASVVVGWDGTTKLGDFGWQRLNGIVAPLGQVQVSDHAAPTVLMAPEQARGGAVSVKSDVFCAALLALRVATGRTPYARFRDTATGVLLAMSEGKVLPLTKTRPELPAAVREAFDRALAPDPEARTVTAQELADAVRAGFDMPRGKASIVKLLDRWREQLEKSMSPWERRASMHDGVVETTDLREGALALAIADDRPSSDALVTNDQPDEPWKKDAKDALPTAETPLAPTDAGASLSRMGAAAESAMSIPLPAVRMTMPSIPVYGPHIGPPPVVAPKPFFTGKRAAFIVFVLFVGLVIGAVYLLQWLSGAH
jgi:hypothetical protein